MLKSYQPSSSGDGDYEEEPSSCKNSFFESDMEIDEVNVKVEVCYCDKTLREFSSILPEAIFLLFFFPNDEWNAQPIFTCSRSLIKNSKCVAK